MAQRVAGEQYESITGQLFELGRQLRQTSGYPFNPKDLKRHLQLAIEGQFNRTPRIIHIDRSVRFDHLSYGADNCILEEEDSRSLALSEIDLTSVKLVNFRKTGSVNGSGERRFRQILDSGDVRLDAMVFETLRQSNGFLIPKSWQPKSKTGSRRIFFDGTILRSQINNFRYVFCLNWKRDRWGWGDDHIDNGTAFEDDFSAVLMS